MMIGNPAAASSAAGDTWKAAIEPLKHAGLDIASQSDVICRKFKRMEVKPLGKSGAMVEIDGGYRGLVPLTVELTGEQINIVSGLEH